MAGAAVCFTNASSSAYKKWDMHFFGICTFRARASIIKILIFYLN